MIIDIIYYSFEVVIFQSRALILRYFLLSTMRFQIISMNRQSTYTLLNILIKQEINHLYVVSYSLLSMLYRVFFLDTKNLICEIYKAHLYLKKSRFYRT